MISLALLAAVSLDAAAIAQTSAALNALGPHAYGSPRNLAAAQFVAAKLKDAGLAQTSVLDFVFEESAGINVVASLPGRSDRLLIIAAHHDTRRDAQDVSDRSRTLALLIEIGRQAFKLHPARTWILGSFDGGESKGEGLAAYLDGLGKTRALVDGVVLLDASPFRPEPGTPTLIVPACPDGTAATGRAIAGRDLVEAALDGVPSSLDLRFDDPGISLLTQPFLRAFRTGCDPMAARALARRVGVILVTDTSYSSGFLARNSETTPGSPGPRDAAMVRLGEVALAAIQGIDASAPTWPQSDSWLVVGRTLLPGWLVFLLGMATLLPALFALRSQPTRLAWRLIYSAVFAAVAYHEPEIALFTGGFPNLVPPSSSRKFKGLALIPAGALLVAGFLGLLRGQVTGTWLPVWIWAGLALGVVLLYLSPSGGRKTPARGKRGRSRSS